MADPGKQFWDSWDSGTRGTAGTVGQRISLESLVLSLESETILSGDTGKNAANLFGWNRSKKLDFLSDD